MMALNLQPILHYVPINPHSLRLSSAQLSSQLLCEAVYTQARMLRNL